MKNLKTRSVLLIIQRIQGAQLPHKDIKEEKTCYKATGDAIVEKEFIDKTRWIRIHAKGSSSNIRAIED